MLLAGPVIPFVLAIDKHAVRKIQTLSRFRVHVRRRGEAMNVLERARVRFLNPVLMLLMICCLTGVTSQVAQAQTYAVLHSFSGGADGAAPMSGLTPDAAGNFYGTAQYGGDPGCGGCGTVFKLARKNGAWVFTPLYAFHGGTDGAWPAARVVIGPDGALYGTTTGGNGSSCSNNGCGTVFRLTPQATFCPTVSCPWVETVLYRFAGAPDGQIPGPGDLVFDQAGNIYGATRAGGTGGWGTVYKLTHSNGTWAESVLYNFTGQSDGAEPNGVIFKNDGSLYGTAEQGGVVFLGYSGAGLIFKLTPSGSGWTQSVVYQFDNDDVNGELPEAGLAIDEAGNLWGTAYSGGQGYCQSFDENYNGCGTVFRWPPLGGGLLAVYAWINRSPRSLSGPLGPVTLDAAGNIYGTTSAMGGYDAGNVFKLTSGQFTYTSLHDLNGSTDGRGPVGYVVMDHSGNLYGVAAGGGGSGICNIQGGCGVIWQITP